MRTIYAYLALAACAFAQQASTTSLIGRVTDTTGAAIPNASVTAVEDGTHTTYTGATNGVGVYLFDTVRIGTYTITASAAGFSTLEQKGVVVEVNQMVRTNFELRVGQASDRVTVSATAAPIATDDAAVTEVLNQRTVADLPLNGRDTLRMAALTPGVITGMKSRTGSNASGGEDFIGAGTREVQNSISLDGVSIVSNLVTTTTLRPSIDATQEFQIQTGT